MNPATLGLAAFNRASHVISRTTLPGLPLSDADKDQLVHLLQIFAAMFFVDVLGYYIDPVK